MTISLVVIMLELTGGAVSLFVCLLFFVCCLLVGFLFVVLLHFLWNFVVFCDVFSICFFYGNLLFCSF